MAEAERLFRRPMHPYTRALLAAIPMPDPDKRSTASSLEGELPDPLNPPRGCGFSTRCPCVLEACRSTHPMLSASDEADHPVRCINTAASIAFAVPNSASA